VARHIYHCPLRWADIDQLGHVNNVVYVDYLQEARVDMLSVHAPASGGEQLAEGVVVVRHDVEYVAPLQFRFEPVRIETWATQIRAASFTLGYEVLDLDPDGGRRVYCRASTVLTPFVFAEERPRRIRPEERAVLERFLEPAEQTTGEQTTGEQTTGEQTR
jgi:acyl-CoA thioester hydrolase